MAGGPADTGVVPVPPRVHDGARDDFRSAFVARDRAYTEAETLAILAAEREGKPHPFAERDGPAAAQPAPEADAFDKGTQLTFWGDDKRAMPTQFIASALFSVVQPKDAGYLDGVVLASGQALTINY